MICPYVQNQCKTIQENILDEENPDIIKKYITTTYWGNAKCIEEKCGVWFEGRCRYNEK